MSKEYEKEIKGYGILADEVVRKFLHPSLIDDALNKSSIKQQSIIVKNGDNKKMINSFNALTFGDFLRMKLGINTGGHGTNMYTVSEISKRIGLHRKTISSLCYNKKSLGYDSAKKIADYMNKHSVNDEDKICACDLLELYNKYTFNSKSIVKS